MNDITRLNRYSFLQDFFNFMTPKLLFSECSIIYLTMYSCARLVFASWIFFKSKRTSKTFVTWWQKDLRQTLIVSESLEKNYNFSFLFSMNTAFEIQRVEWRRCLVLVHNLNVFSILLVTCSSIILCPTKNKIWKKTVVFVSYVFFCSTSTWGGLFNFRTLRIFN